MTRTWAPASSGWISGVGFAMAKTMGSRLIFWMSLSDTTPGPESPMKTSAPARASPAEPLRPLALVFSANHCFIEFMFSVRPL